MRRSSFSKILVFVIVAALVPVVLFSATAMWPTPRTTGTTDAPTDATYITQTANDTLSAEQAMGALGTGAVWNTTTTGVQSISAGLTSIGGLTETNGGIPYGTADNAYAWLAAGTAGYLLQANGAAAPTWVVAPSGGSILRSQVFN